MRIVIEHHKIKRKLEGDGFNICGSREDLQRIADQLTEALEEDFYYGWVRIRDLKPDEHSAPNSEPLPWNNNAVNTKP